MWVRQSKDGKGKEKCEAQAKSLEDYVKWVKETKGEKGSQEGKGNKGKKGKGAGKAKGSEEVIEVEDSDGDAARSSFQ